MTLELALATFGGILILISFGGGIKRLKTQAIEKEEYVPAGDRAYAGIVGIFLILAAVASKAVGSGFLLWGSIGAATFVTLLYARFLWRTSKRPKE